MVYINYFYKLPNKNHHPESAKAVRNKIIVSNTHWERERERDSLGQSLTLEFFKLHAVGSWSSLASWIPKFLIASLPLWVCWIMKHKHSGSLSLIPFTDVQHSFVGVSAFPVAKFRHWATLDNCWLHFSATPAPLTSQTKPHNNTKNKRDILWDCPFILFIIFVSFSSLNAWKSEES